MFSTSATASEHPHSNERRNEEKPRPSNTMRIEIHDGCVSVLIATLHLPVVYKPPVYKPS